MAYVYFESEPGRRAAANLMTNDEARKIAAGIAKAAGAAETAAGLMAPLQKWKVPAPAVASEDCLRGPPEPPVQAVG